MRFELRKGWTRERLKQAIRAGNNGTPAIRTYPDPARPVVTRLACEYLTADGNRCFVGCLIPDGHPGLSYSGAVHGLLFSYDLEEHMPMDVAGLMQLQAVHDDEALLGRHPRNLHALADAWIDANTVDPG